MLRLNKFHGIFAFFGVSIGLIFPTSLHAALKEFDSRWFAKDSPWNVQIPPSSPTAPYSATVMAAYKDHFHGINMNLDTWTPAVIVAPAGTQTHEIDIKNWRLHRVPVTDQALAAADFFSAHKDTDSSVCIYSEDKHRFYSLWEIKRDASGHSLNVGAGANDGIDGPGWWDNGKGPWIGRASGASYCGGLIRPEELKDGQIDHALAAGWPHNLIRNSKLPIAYVYPATSTDGAGMILSQDIPMGSRLQLDPTMSDNALTALGLTSADLVIAHALQQYGVYITDSASVFVIYFQSGLGKGKTLYPGLSQTLPHSLLDHMRIVGTPPPTVPLDDRTKTNDIEGTRH